MNYLSTEWIAFFYMAAGIAIVGWKLRNKSVGNNYSPRELIRQLYSVFDIKI